MPKLVVSRRHLRRKAAQHYKNILQDLNSKHDTSNSSLINTSKFDITYSHFNPSDVNLPSSTITDDYTFNKVTQNTEFNCETLRSSKPNELFSVFQNFNHNNYTPNNVSNGSHLSINEDENHGKDTGINRTDEQFTQEFKNWAVNSGISHDSLNNLLTIIRPQYPFLKKDARSILGTPRTIKTIELENGKMVYFGISDNVKRRIKQGLTNNETNLIELQINIDGLPLFNSSATEFWPILAKSDVFLTNKIFTVAIFCGRGKPTPLESFLKQFVAELLLIYEKGITYMGKTYFLKVGLFTCDAPARAYLKNIRGHNSTFGCERCNLKSRYSDKRRYYPVNVKGTPRRDDNFCNVNCDTNHIKGFSPLLKLNVKLVSSFVLDPMHLIYLGVMKRLFKYWLEGKRQFKISKSAVEQINLCIRNIHMPNDFGRKLRTLKDAKHFKATEYRTFLLYCGVILLKNKISSECYVHFLLLHVAVTILSSETLISNYIHVAESALKQFVFKCPKIYDKFFVVYNVHSLLHVCDDCRQYGSLEKFSCFDFENHLGFLKRRVKGKYLPLQQIHNRITEMNNCITSEKSVTENVYVPKGINSEDDGNFQCKTLLMDKFDISVTFPNNIVSVHNKVCVVKSIYYFNEEYKFLAVPFRHKCDLYTNPISSSHLGIYLVKGQNEPSIFLVKEISYKYFPIKQSDNTLAVFPLNHLR